MSGSLLPPVHPGEILKDLYLSPLQMSAGTLARRLGVPRSRIERIVARTHPITPDTALRLARFFGTSPEFWMNMQTGYDLKLEEAAKGEEIGKIEALAAA